MPAQAGLVKAQPLPRLADDPTQPDAAKSTVGVAELVEDNFAIVKLYRDLAHRHDALVDDVMQHLQDQTK